MTDLLFLRVVKLLRLTFLCGLTCLGLCNYFGRLRPQWSTVKWHVMMKMTSAEKIPAWICMNACVEKKVSSNRLHMKRDYFVSMCVRESASWQGLTLKIDVYCSPPSSLQEEKNPKRRKDCWTVSAADMRRSPDATMRKLTPRSLISLTLFIASLITV